MTITLTPEQLKWLEAQVAAGHFASVEEAVQTAITDFMAAASEETGEDLERLRQLIDAGDADIAAVGFTNMPTLASSRPRSSGAKNFDQKQNPDRRRSRATGHRRRDHRNSAPIRNS
jgi:antitoxin ParD1/3/4